MGEFGIRTLGCEYRHASVVPMLSVLIGLLVMAKYWLP